MATLARRAQRSTNIWPGFVDALATLLLVIMFLLMVFVLAQFFLNEAISGRDTALQKLQSQVNELAELLALGRQENEAMRLNVSQLSDELQASVARQDDLRATLEALTERAEGAEADAKRLKTELDDAFKTIVANKETIEVQLTKLSALSREVATLDALKKELEKEVAVLLSKIRTAEAALAAEHEGKAESERLLAEEREKAETQSTVLAEERKLLAEERELSESARAQLALANRQMAALREQLARLSEALDASEKLAKEQNVQIASLGKRLNAALATKVQELSRYRSEFFGRLREVLGDHPGIRIVGDRFVFQSEVLFESGSADLGAAGGTQLAQLASTLAEISSKIPKEIDWILRIDGHTDSIPIKTAKFPSNWELSAARAISVVRFLVGSKIPPNRLVAAGFGKHQPLDTRGDEIANRRNRRIEFKLTQR